MNLKILLLSKDGLQEHSSMVLHNHSDGADLLGKTGSWFLFTNLDLLSDLNIYYSVFSSR